MSVKIITGDCREMLATLPDQSVHCCVTSPPYFGLRDYGMAAQIGLEQTPDAFVAELVAVFREVWRVLRDDGTLFLNIGDSYFGSSQTGGTNSKEGSSKRAGRMFSGTPRATVCDGLKPKDLIGIPWMLAFALRADGWFLRQDIIWHKPNPMPESVTDRCTKAHEYVFLMSKSARYFYDAGAIAEEGSGRIPGNKVPQRTDASHGKEAERMLKAQSEPQLIRNRRSVWTVATQPYSGAHFATFPPALIEPCILAGCPAGGTVLDPFGGAGTTGLVADRLGRNAVLIELNPAYAGMAKDRIEGDARMFAQVSA